MNVTVTIPDADAPDVAAHMAQQFGVLTVPLLPPSVGIQTNPPAGLLALDVSSQLALLFAALVRDASYQRKFAVQLDALTAQAAAVPTLDAKALGVDVIVTKGVAGP